MWALPTLVWLSQKTLQIGKFLCCCCCCGGGGGGGCNSCCSCSSSVPVVAGGISNSEGTPSGELRKAHQLTKELEGEKRKRISLQRECVVYQSQLEVNNTEMQHVAACGSM